MGRDCSTPRIGRQVGMDYLPILATAIITSATTTGFASLKERWMRSREAKFSALYAALFFEEYAVACSHCMGEIDDSISSGGHAGIDHQDLPDLPDWPKEIDWRQVGIRQTERAFGFRVQLEAAARKIAYLYDFDPPDGGAIELRDQLTARGLEALAIAADIRAANHLAPAAIPYPDHTTERHLTERRAHWSKVAMRIHATVPPHNGALEGN